MNFQHDPDEFKRFKKIVEAAVGAGMHAHEVGPHLFVGTGAHQFLNALTGYDHPYQSAAAVGAQIHNYIKNPRMLEQFKTNVAEASKRSTQVRRAASVPVQRSASGTANDLLKRSKQ